MFNTEIFNELIARLRSDKGFSYAPQSFVRNPQTGYMVSLKGYETIFPSIEDITPEDIARYFALVTDHFCFIGGWVADDGKVYLDLSEWWIGRDEAIEEGIKNEQIAIWDCYRQVSITL